METKFKVGQKVMTKGTIIGFDKSEPIVNWDSDNNCIQPYVEPFKEREMLVWDDREAEAKERTVVSNINGKWQIKAGDGFGVGGNYLFAKEIEPNPEETKETSIDLLIRAVEMAGYNVTKK